MFTKLGLPEFSTAFYALPEFEIPGFSTVFVELVTAGVGKSFGVATVLGIGKLSGESTGLAFDSMLLSQAVEIRSNEFNISSDSVCFSTIISMRANEVGININRGSFSSFIGIFTVELGISRNTGKLSGLKDLYVVEICNVSAKGLIRGTTNINFICLENGYVEKPSVQGYCEITAITGFVRPC